MNAKDKLKKTTRPKSIEKVMPIPAYVVANVVGCSEAMVKKTRRGVKNTQLASLIQLTEETLFEGFKTVITKTKNVINP